MKQEKVRKRDLLSILAVALVTFAGILSETSMNVTFPHLSQVFGLSLGVYNGLRLAICWPSPSP